MMKDDFEGTDTVTVECIQEAFARVGKPKQYAKGIDTFNRAKANMSIEGIMAATVMTVDAYIWRTNGTDYEDFVKARDWLNFVIEAMEENEKGNK